MIKFINIYIILISGLLLACNTSSNDNTDSEDVEKIIEAEIQLDSFLLANKVVEKLDYIIENLQSSDNLIKQLSSDINLFSDGILNDVSNASVYESAREKALNLGIYGADLNYLIHFSQTQTSFKYLLTSKQLADQIGVAMAFDQNVIEEYQSKSENKDTLLNIVFGAYKDVKKLLKNNEQFQLSALVIAGSWIENMYITTNLLTSNNSINSREVIIKELNNQKFYLNKINELLEILNQDNNPYVVKVLESFNVINTCYINFESAGVDESNINQFKVKIQEARNKLSHNK